MLSDSSTISAAGKAKKAKKNRQPFYKGYGVVYLPGDIKGLSGALRHSVGVFQLIFGTQYFCLFGSLDESMLKILV